MQVGEIIFDCAGAICFHGHEPGRGRELLGEGHRIYLHRATNWGIIALVNGSAGNGVPPPGGQYPGSLALMKRKLGRKQREAIEFMLALTEEMNQWVMEEMDQWVRDNPPDVGFAWDGHPVLTYEEFLIRTGRIPDSPYPII